MLKLIILKSHPKVFLLGDVVELDEEPSYLLQNCHEVTGHGIVKYPPYSDQDDLFLESTDVMTVVDPSPAIARDYLVMLESKEKKAKNE